MDETDESKKQCRWLWWGGGTAAVLVVLAVVFNGILPFVAARAASNLLGLDVSIGMVNVSIFSGDVVVEDIRVSQPEGLGDEPMLRVGRVAVDGWLGVLASVRHLDGIYIEDVHVELISRADGTSTGLAMLDLVATESDTATAEDESVEDDALAILIDRISVSSVTIVRRDELGEGQEHRLELAGDQLTVNRLAIGDVGEIAPVDIEFSGGVVQPGVERAEAFMAGQFSGLGGGAVNLRVSGRVTGCLFETFFPLIPKNTGVALGGKGFDGDLEVKVAGGMIDVRGKSVTSTKSAYRFEVTGPVDAPKIYLPKKLRAVTSRMTGGAGRLVRSGLGTGGELLEGTAKTVGTLGKGAISAVGSVVKGAGQSAVGVVTADGEKIKSGGTSMTAETGSHVAGAVSGSAEEIAQAGGKSAQAIGSDPKTQKWLADIPARHGERTDGLLAGIFAEDFPPLIGPPEASDEE